ncbi:osmotically-inducible lipoprotein OsmE [Pseudomonas benzenivorans]|uniref:Osmotically-inducible lipoprotein OsmE n=1 Tax=Pseudomonas benzenivorans TaxID=556533 RepID=A0ABZ0PY99_9PSED|nr:osmotically-inducible lipoprotein OsmE [Pseudomonas benzenivorans]WPC05845.1 osmotically-inducible lipoprotein OsmE [Pseudomonas benzenivorans]
MHQQTLGVLALLSILSGCAGSLGNPNAYLTYRDEPLVAQVARDMSKQQVLEIGGAPSGVMPRSVNPGSCHDYILTRDGQPQAYHVSFDSAGRVDGKGFRTCTQMEDDERARARRPVGIGGGGGY